MNRIQKFVTSHAGIIAGCIGSILIIWTFLNILFFNHKESTNYITVVGACLFIAFFFTSYHHVLTPNLKKFFTKIFIGTLILYAVYLGLYIYTGYTHYVFESTDLSQYHLSIWQLSEFKLPYIWDMPSVPIWQQHFEPIILFIVPLYWMIKNAGILVIIQFLWVVGGTIPLFFVSRRIFKSTFIALSLAYTYLVFGGMQAGYFYGFHPIMFFPTLFFCMYYWYSRKNTVLYFIFVMLCLFVKEEISLVMIFWGLYLVLFKKEKYLGIGTVILGICWYILCFHLIFPYFSPKEGFVYWVQYNQAYGSGISGIFKFASHDPYAFLNTLISPHNKIDTVLYLFGAFSFIPLLYPPSLLIVVPSILEKLLSSGIASSIGSTHYTAASTGVVIIATLETLQYVRNTSWGKFLIRNIGIGSLLLLTGFFANTLYGIQTYAVPPFGTFIPPDNENIQKLSEIIQSIPDSATVGAQYIIAPHIQKPFGKITPWPHDGNEPDYIILDNILPLVLTDKPTVTKNLDMLYKNSNYTYKVYNEDIMVFTKNQK
jgi:uncharacterized membrane protein